MGAVEFCQGAMRERIAPPSLGTVKERIRHAARKTGLGYYRARDIWYADSRVSIGADELRRIERLSGVRYGREELRDLNQLIAQADALLHGRDPNFRSAFAAAVRAFLGALAGSGAQDGE